VTIAPLARTRSPRQLTAVLRGRQRWKSFSSSWITSASIAPVIEARFTKQESKNRDASKVDHRSNSEEGLENAIGQAHHPAVATAGFDAIVHEWIHRRTAMGM